MRRRGPPAPRGQPDVRLLIVGSGPEEQRLRAYARELGIADAGRAARRDPYEEMPDSTRPPRCMVLASLATWSWEEQFGWCSRRRSPPGVPVLASTSGAIPSARGRRAPFAPGDWLGLADTLAEAIAAPPAPDRAGAADHSARAAAARLAAAYDELLARSPAPGALIADSAPTYDASVRSQPSDRRRSKGAAATRPARAASR